ncbi:MAG: amino acid permease [Candidatus Omnitrophota bacterium]
MKRELGLLEIFCIASGAMISSGLFILPGLAYAQAGPAVIISYLLAGFISLAGMLSIAEMTTAMPKAGGDCFTVIRSMGPAIGTVAGLLSWFSLSMKSAFALIGMSVFTMMIVSVDIHIIAVSFCFIFLIVNIIGVKEAAKTQVVMVVGLLILMFLYVVWGMPSVEIARFTPFVTHGFRGVFSTAGFVFVSYAGLLKIASVAEEVRNPGRNIPLGMILSLIVVVIFYIFMIFVAVGVLAPSKLSQSLTPISDAAEVFMGLGGKIALAIAAILAFLSTANAGIMTAARSLVPLSRDGLFPGIFGNFNRRFATPQNALFLTGFFIVLSFFLKLEILVEAASITLILTNLLACFSIIILRESKIQNYRPRFRAPLYPWLQIFGILTLGFLIFEMGKIALIITFLLIVGGFLTYWLYGRVRGYREYALLHLIGRITAKELTSRSLEQELKEIIRERDNIISDRFDAIIENSLILDIDKALSLEEFFKLVADTMADKLQMESTVLFDLLMRREKEGSTAIMPTLAIPHIVIEGEKHFAVLLVRCRRGIMFSQNIAPNVHTVFVLVGTKDERQFHLVSLAAISQIIKEHDFEKRWLEAKNQEDLRDIVLLGKRRRAE